MSSRRLSNTALDNPDDATNISYNKVESMVPQTEEEKMALLKEIINKYSEL